MLTNLSQIDLKLNPFVPYLPWMTGHTQTLLGHFVPSPLFKQDCKKVLLPLPDGDHLSLRIYRQKQMHDRRASDKILNSNFNTKIIVVLYHGLGGDHLSDYMQRTAQLAYDRGLLVVHVNHRGGVDTENLAQKPYHSGRGEDLSEVHAYLRRHFPDYLQLAIGFSLSGSMLLNLLTGRFGTVLPDYAVVMNAPLNLQTTSEALARGVSKIYDLRFYYRLKKAILRKHPEMKLPLSATTYYIDDVFTSKRSGFNDRFDYYAKCSTYDILDRIQTPTFVLTSEDDPFILFSDYVQGQWPEKFVHKTFLKHGGHMGYYSKHHHNPFGRRWMDHYLSRVLDQIQGK